jgi:hypothetical protein
MNIQNAITTIDAGFEPDPAGMIDAIGITADGRKVDLWIHNDGSGPLIHPGASFLPYGGVYFNPLLVSVTES